MRLGPATARMEALHRMKDNAAGPRWVCVALAALGLGLPLLIIGSVVYPPQFDTPNHLARHYLESLALRGSPLPPGYTVEYRLLPNLGADFVLPPLMLCLEPLTACRLFLMLAVVLYWAGPALFVLQAGEYRLPARVAALLLLPFVLSSAFFWGFLNYYSGVGLAFLVVVHLRRLDRQGRLSVAGLLVQTGLAALLFFWHLAAVFIYGVLAGTLALERGLAQRRAGRPLADCAAQAAMLLAPLIPAGVLWSTYMIAKAAVPAPASEWGGPLRKLLMPLTLFRGYDGTTDAIVIALWIAALAAFYGRPRAIGGWPALAAGAFAVLYLALPFQWGSTSDADSRLLPPLLVCGLAWLGTMPLRRFWLGAVLLAVALLVRGGAVWSAWHRLDDRLQAAARSFDYLEENARVLPAILVPAHTKEDPENHFVCLAVIARHAYVPTLFAYRDQQPLALDGPPPLPELFNGPVFTLPAATAAPYDYLWVYNPHGVELRLPPDCTQTFADGAVSVWRLHLPKG